LDEVTSNAGPDLTILPNCTRSDDSDDCGEGGLCVPGFNKCAFSCSAEDSCADYEKLAAVKDDVTCHKVDDDLGLRCVPSSNFGPSGGDGPSDARKICQPKGLKEYKGPSQCQGADGACSIQDFMASMEKFDVKKVLEMLATLMPSNGTMPDVLKNFSDSCGNQIDKGAPVPGASCSANCKTSFAAYKGAVTKIVDDVSAYIMSIKPTTCTLTAEQAASFDEVEKNQNDMLKDMMAPFAVIDQNCGIVTENVCSNQDVMGAMEKLDMKKVQELMASVMPGPEGDAEVPPVFATFKADCKDTIGEKGPIVGASCSAACKTSFVAYKNAVNKAFGDIAAYFKSFKPTTCTLSVEQAANWDKMDLSSMMLAKMNEDFAVVDQNCGIPTTTVCSDAVVMDAVNKFDEEKVVEILAPVKPASEDGPMPVLFEKFFGDCQGQFGQGGPVAGRTCSAACKTSFVKFEAAVVKADSDLLAYIDSLKPTTCDLTADQEEPFDNLSVGSGAELKMLLQGLGVINTNCATKCLANFAVTNKACVACPAGTTNAAGDDDSGADTSCDKTLCLANFAVTSNACVACPAGTTNAAGDDASGANTSCDKATEATTAAPTAAPTEAATTTTAKKAGDSDSIGAGSSLIPHIGGVMALLMMVIALVL